MTFLRMKLLLFVSLILFSFQGLALDRIGRLGLGISNQLSTSTPGLSFKIQQNREFSFGGVVAVESGSNGSVGAGLKAYKNIFEEQNLNFYAAGLLGYIYDKSSGVSQSGLRADLTFGSEFSFYRLESLGFSFEFGISLDNIEDFQVSTAGSQYLTMALHFYL